MQLKVLFHMFHFHIRTLVLMTRFCSVRVKREQIQTTYRRTKTTHTPQVKNRSSAASNTHFFLSRAIDWLVYAQVVSLKSRCISQGCAVFPKI